MASNTLNFNNKIQYEIISGDQILLINNKTKVQVLINGISFNLVISLIMLQSVSYDEFILINTKKYANCKNITSKIKIFIGKLKDLGIITFS